MGRAALLTASALLALACRPQQAEQESAQSVAVDPTPRVVLETTSGQIVVQLDREKAPTTVENFLAHVDIGFYDGLIFHRVERGFVIQAGYYTPDMRRASTSAAPIMNEGQNGLPNVRGSVAMARTDYPHSATTQFFINLKDNPSLNADQYGDGFGHAVFGHVVDGMDVIDRIAAARTNRRGTNLYLPVVPIVINRAFVLDEDA
jgi:peptidyl-prolyl cis-trans isomerase A (cyclophilin A)